MMLDNHSDHIARTTGNISTIPRAVMHAALRSDSLNVCHINVQSLCARQMSKFDEFKSCFVNSKVDLICATETWLSTDIADDMISIDGYNLLRNDRNHGRGGGICVYSKKNLKCKIVIASNQSVIPPNSECTEYLFIEVRCNNDKFLLGVYYNPPRVDCSETLDRKFVRTVTTVY